MSADFDQIYDFETAIESAFKSFFTSQEIPCYTSADASAEIQKLRPRVELLYQHGSENGHNWTNSTYYRPDTFTATLAVGVVSNAKEDGAGHVEHSQFRARVRNAMMKARDLLNADRSGDDTLLPYHSVMDIMEVGTSPAYGETDGHLVTRINYELKINIRSTAWPEE